MEHMRMDPKHQFAAQYVLSRAAAERRERDSILATTLAASTGGSGNSSSALLPLLGDGGGSNSLCPSPSANSDCSSTGHLSSSAASDQGIHLLANNNNNNCNSNKLNELLNHTGSNPHLQSQYTVGVDTDLHLTNRMSLMAAASAAAAAVAASATSVGVSGGINVSRVSTVGITSPSSCADSTRSSVQAAVVNLAAAMRISQVSQQQSGVNIGSRGSGCSSVPSSASNISSQQSMNHQQQQASTPESLQSSVSTPLTASDFRVGASSPRSSTVISNLHSGVSTVNAVVTMTAMRDTMIRTGMSVVDPVSGIHQHHDQKSQDNVQPHTTANNLYISHANYGQHSEPIVNNNNQIQNQVATALHNSASHHHHQHLNHIQQSHSPETTLRMQKHAEAILRSHTEAAFRLAASVASNGVMCAASGTLTAVTEANSIATTTLPNSSVQDKIETHIPQQQQPLQQHQQHHPTAPQQHKLNIEENQQQHTLTELEHSQLTSDLSEAIRLQEQRLEQALRLHSDARALNFISAAHQNANITSGVATVSNIQVQHQHQQQTLTTQQNHGNA